MVIEKNMERRPKIGGGGAPIPKIGGASKLSAAARRDRRRALN